MSRLTKRLVELEARQPVGCPACRGWAGTVVVHVDEAGHEYWRSRSDACSACGRVVPVRCRVELVGPWDAQ